MSGKKLTPIRTYKAGGKTVIRYKCECGKESIFPGKMTDYTKEIEDTEIRIKELKAK